jgi:hypothetical protein
MQSSGRYREEVDRDQISDVIIEKRSPRLGWGGVPFRHKPGNRTLENLDSQLQQFAMDARCPPTHIGSAIVFTSFRMSPPVRGRPGFLCRDNRDQYRLKRLLCQSTTVSG